MTNLNNIRLFQVQYKGATNTNGARLIIKDTRFNKRKTIAYDYSSDNVADMASKYLDSIGIALMPFKSYNEINGVYSLFTNDFNSNLI